MWSREAIKQLMEATGGLAATSYVASREADTLDLLGTTLSDERMPAEWRRLSVAESALPAARAVRGRRRALWPGWRR
ncbi:MAG: hypothetical protein H0W82_08805 [Actinobacteria bacterium]|nr:hypothetical protein [Actinomycetota bacterium]